MKISRNCDVSLNFFTKNIRIKNDFLMDTYSMILAWVQRWNNFEKLMKLRCRHNYFSSDQHFVILAWVQSWNIFEKLMKVCSPPEFFHRNMSHEQLLFTWSTFRDSSMGTKLKHLWKTHERVKSAWNFSQKHVSRTITFHVIHISWF